MKEVWKDIIGYEGLYKVSNTGLVKSFVGQYGIKENQLKPGSTGKGYHRVCLYKDGKGKSYFVHRLVALAFIKNPKNLATVDHIDCDKTNNGVSNLRWMSNEDNASRGNKGNQNRKGKTHSAETKAKMAESMRGNTNATGKRSEESRAKMSESAKRRWKNR